MTGLNKFKQIVLAVICGMELSGARRGGERPNVRLFHRPGAGWSQRRRKGVDRLKIILEVESTVLSDGPAVGTSPGTAADGWRVSREEAGRRRQFGEKRGGTVTHVRLHADTLDFYYL